ncbi:hypothetical protein AMECASPLE_003597 [Ameca splendens]|uniref:Uncharacterized protein n=1 Tax=Ameca splendens TaxID=208324 RepID=A0ABV0XYF3_9TELE
MLDGEGLTVVKGVSQVSTVTPAPKPAPVLTAAPVIQSADAASARLVSRTKLVKIVELCFTSYVAKINTQKYFIQTTSSSGYSAILGNLLKAANSFSTENT